MSRPPFSLTLIVATSPTLGIGLNGGLPWRIRAEMAYFKRVTSRVSPTLAVPLPPAPAPAPAPAPPHSSPATSASVPSSSPAAATSPQPQNAVLMGRKTWDSIPPKFRPLDARLNVVLSRSMTTTTTTPPEGCVRAESLADAVRLLRSRHEQGVVGRVFVIGGAEVYRAAMELPETRDVLLTRVEGDWEVDAWFPADLEREEGWRRGSAKEWKEFTGETGDARGKEGDVEFEYRLYTRK